MLSKFLDPKNDVAFRRVFGTERNKEILIHFLNDMLTFKEKGRVVDVTFLKTVQDPVTAAKKVSIVDILCQDQVGNSYIVEMQVAKERGFVKRAQYHASKAYCAQANVGDGYDRLKEIIFLVISDCVIFPDKEEFKSDHVILDRESLENDLKDFSFTFVELPKFRKEAGELQTMADKWCYFFKHVKETPAAEIEQIMRQDKIMERAFHELDRFYWDDEELLDYDQAQKYDEGRAEGKLLTRKFIERGLDFDVIAEATGLSPLIASKTQTQGDLKGVYLAMSSGAQPFMALQRAKRERGTVEVSPGEESLAESGVSHDQLELLRLVSHGEER